MSLRFRLLILVCCVITLIFAILCERAFRQRSAVQQLLEFDSLELIYQDGDRDGELVGIKPRNHFVQTVVAVHLDVTSDEVSELIPALRRLPGLATISIVYQGDEEPATRKCHELRQAFPAMKIEATRYYVRFPVVG